MAPDVVAKAWLLQRVAASPLADTAGLPVAPIAAAGPAFCAAVLDAVRSVSGLDGLRTAVATGRQAGLFEPDGVPGVVFVTEALRQATWRSIAAENTGELDPVAVGDLADRLAHVCAVVAELALSTAGERIDLDRCLAINKQDGVPVSLLVAEVDDLENLAAAEPGPQLVAELEAATQRLRAAMGDGETLEQQAPGRWSVVAPGADATAAQTLADRLTSAFDSGAPSRHGVALELRIGAATCPDDATDATGLIAEAEIALFSARASS